MVIGYLFDGPSAVQMGYIIAGIIAFCLFVISLIVLIVSIIKKSKKPRKVSLILAVIMLFLYITSGALLSLSNTGEFGYILDPAIGFDNFTFVYPFENEKGKRVVYDIKGNEYTYNQYCNGFMYYDRSGKEYKLTTINASEQTQELVCLDTGEKYEIAIHMASDKMFYIDEDGYFCLNSDVPPLEEGTLGITDDEDVAYYYFDSKGKNYYAWNLVTWDKQGDMYYDGYPMADLHPVENADGI